MVKSVFKQPTGLIVAPPQQGPNPSAGVSSDDIAVRGLEGTILRVSLTLNGLTLLRPESFRASLVNRGLAVSVNAIERNGGSIPVTELILQLDNNFRQPLPVDSKLTSGSFRPFRLGNDFLSSNNFNVFRNQSPNGNWFLSLGISNGPKATLSRGWELAIYHGVNPVITDPRGLGGRNSVDMRRRVNTYAGGPGTEIYKINRRATQSSFLRKLDHITDFDTDNDAFDHPLRRSRTRGQNFGRARSLKNRQIRRLLKPNVFKPRRWGTFTVGSPGPLERTFLVINNNKRGFQQKGDFLVEITGHYGSTPLSQIDVF